MRLQQPNAKQALAGLRAMKTIGLAQGEIGPAHLALMQAAQAHVLHTKHNIELLTPITPSELGEAIDDPAIAEQLVHAMAIISVADDSPTARAAELIKAYSIALKTNVSEPDILLSLAHKHSLLFRFDFYRRSHLRSALEEQFNRRSFLDALQQIAAFRGILEDSELANKYRSLGTLPPDTVGYAFYHHYADNGFAFPGEKYGFPEGGVYHDFSHVLGGYGTTSEEEMLVSGFIAGFRKENPAFVMLFTMLTFGAGVNMTPINQPHSQHIMATPGLADRFFRAIDRGSKVNVDLSVNWDHWAWVEKKLSDAQKELGIEPE